MNKPIPEMSLVLPGEFCHRCSNFKPVVESSDFYANGQNMGNYRTIVCENESLCRNLMDFLRKQDIPKEEDDRKPYGKCTDCKWYTSVGCLNDEVGIPNPIIDIPNKCKGFLRKEK